MCLLVRTGESRIMMGKEINKYAKIIEIANVFDAITSNRVYREAMLPHIGLEILYAGAVDIFDRDMVEAFKGSIVAYPNGLTVELNDHRTGVVIKQNKHICDRPIIEIIKEGDKILEATYKVDLSQEMNLTIVACYAD